MLYVKNIEIKENYDIVVCGGGFSGFAAAYASAREGAKVNTAEIFKEIGKVSKKVLEHVGVKEKMIQAIPLFCGSLPM